MRKPIPYSDEARREYARRQRKRKQIAKGAVIGLGLLTVSLLFYTFYLGL